MKTCQRCDDPIPEDRQRRHARFCGESCMKAANREKYRSANPTREIALPPGTVGALAELVVAADLMARGFEVFHAMSPSSSCDLAVLAAGRLLRVEVRSGFRRLSGGLFFGRVPKDEGRQDLFAVVVEAREVLYFAPDGTSPFAWENVEG